MTVDVAVQENVAVSAEELERIGHYLAMVLSDRCINWGMDANWAPGEELTYQRKTGRLESALEALEETKPGRVDAAQLARWTRWMGQLMPIQFADEHGYAEACRLHDVLTARVKRARKAALLSRGCLTGAGGGM